MVVVCASCQWRCPSVMGDMVWVDVELSKVHMYLWTAQSGLPQQVGSSVRTPRIWLCQILRSFAAFVTHLICTVRPEFQSKVVQPTNYRWQMLGCCLAFKWNPTDKQNILDWILAEAGYRQFHKVQAGLGTMPSLCVLPITGHSWRGQSFELWPTPLPQVVFSSAPTVLLELRRWSKVEKGRKRILNIAHVVRTCYQRYPEFHIHHSLDPRHCLKLLEVASGRAHFVQCLSAGISGRWFRLTCLEQ